MIEIGKIKIDNPCVLAPLAGYTDPPFRTIARRHGAGLVFTELISSEGMVRKIKNTMDLLKFRDEERPIGIQIFGKNPEVMGEAASIAEELNPDMIDINFGCSVRRIVHGGAGAAILDDPVLLGAIAETVVRRVRVPVSAKIRIGIDERKKNYMETLAILEGSGVSLVSVHGRTRAQAFRGFADWDVIREIAEKAVIPVIGNGDINSYEEALMRLNTSGCSAVMIGRGAVGNPWIFSGREPGWDEIVQQIREHLDMMIGHYGENGIILMRKHIVKYIRGRRNSSRLRSMLVNKESRDEILKILADSEWQEKEA